MCQAMEQARSCLFTSSEICRRIAGLLGQDPVVVGKTASEAHEDNSVHGTMECQAASPAGSCSHTSWSFGKPGQALTAVFQAQS